MTKLTPPRLFDYRPRARLAGVLHEQLHRPVVWVWGPPGAGKTTLLANYCHEAGRDHVWYQVDAGDGDAATFFYYLRRARRQESLPLLEPHAVGDLGIFARRFFRDFFAEFSDPPLLVLDNFHLAEGSGLASLVLDACQEIPDGGHVIVISRDAPPAEFARLRASRQVGLIGWDELRFTVAEVAQLLPAGVATAGALVQSMHDRSGGWAAALVLMLENLRGSGRSMSLTPVAAADEQTVFDYLASEVFDNFDAKTRHMLLHVCDLPSVTAQQAVAMAEDPDAGRLLEQLYRRGYFTDLRLRPAPVFQLHGLFRDFLRQRAETMLATQRGRILDRAAHLLEKEGQLEEAIALFARARRWRSAVRLILKEAPGFLRTGRGPVLATQIRSLPAEVMAQEPWLGYWLGMCHLREEPQSARTTLEQAYLEFARVADVKGQLFAAAAVVETYYFEWSGFAPLDRWIERLAALLVQVRRLPADAKATIYSSAMVAMLYRQPRHPLLPNLAREVHDALLSEAISDPDQKMTTGTFLLNYYNWCGDVARAGQIAAEMTPLAQRSEISPVRRAWWWLRLAYHEFLLARHDHALAALDRARSEAEAYGLVAVRNVAALYEMFVRLSRGEISACEGLSADLERQIVPSRRLDVAIAQYQKSWLAFMRNDDASALRHARIAAALADEAGVPNIHGYFLVASALGEARCGEPDSAATFGRGLSRTSLEAYPLLEFSARLTEAAAALAREDAQACRNALERALAIGRREGYANCLLWLPDCMSVLLACALSWNMETEYARSLILARHLPCPSRSLEHWPWPLRVYSLGAFRLEIDGKPVRFAGKVPRKPLELLKFLVARGGRDVEVTAVMDSLWPDSEGDAGYKAFEMALSRLRKILGRADTLILTEGRLSLDPRWCWTDVWALELHLEAGEQHGKRSATEELAEAEKVLALYRGSFLDGADDPPWAVALRDRLHHRVLRLLRHAGATLEASRDWKSAAGIYSRVIDADPRVEDLYAKLMVCLRELGEAAAAREVFRRCRDFMSRTLGTQPSDAVRAVYDSL